MPEEEIIEERSSLDANLGFFDKLIVYRNCNKNYLKK